MANLITRTFLERQFQNYSVKVDEVFSRKSAAAHSLEVSMDNKTYVITLELLSESGVSLAKKTVDLPLEATVVTGSYDKASKTLTLTLKSGSTVEIPLSDLIAGLMSDSVTVAGLKVKDNPTADQLSTALSAGLTDIDFTTIFDME